MATGVKMVADYAANFWAAVADCLVRFHHFENGAALQKAYALRESLERTARSAAERDMIFHEEPWYIACDLAGRENATLGPEESVLYATILKKHGLFPNENNQSMTARR